MAAKAFCLVSKRALQACTDDDWDDGDDGIVLCEDVCMLDVTRHSVGSLPMAEGSDGGASSLGTCCSFELDGIQVAGRLLEVVFLIIDL